MVNIYNSGAVPSYKSPRRLLALAELNKIMAKSRDPEELRHYWEGWRDAVGGRGMGTLFDQHVELANQAARIAGFADAAEMDREEYEEDEGTDFAKELETAWREIRHEVVLRQKHFEKGTI